MTPRWFARWKRGTKAQALVSAYQVAIHSVSPLD